MRRTPRLPSVPGRIPCLMLMTGLFAAFILAMVPQAGAQIRQGIAAVVNDTVITFRDLESRISLVVATSNLPDTAANRRALQGRVLQTLINEQLQTAEASRHGIRVTGSEIDRAERSVEQRNRLPQGAYRRFLAANGLSGTSSDNQFRASISWTKLVNRRFGGLTRVTAEEVTEIQEAYRSNIGRPQYLLSEILLLVNSLEQERDIRGLAERIVSQVRRGSDFGTVAGEFSDSPSASSGGRIGWITPGLLDPKIESVIAEMEPGEVSDPIRTRSGYRIMKLLNRQTPVASDPMLASVALKQVFLPLPAEPEDADVQASLASARIVKDRARTCADMDILAAEVGSTVGTDLGVVRLGDLSPDIVEAIRTLPVGQPSAPVRLDAGVTVLMVCERTDPPSNIPTRDQIVQQLRGEKIETMAQRYLRDLRRNAFIETRL